MQLLVGVSYGTGGVNELLARAIGFRIIVTSILNQEALTPTTSLLIQIFQIEGV
jgi:hypothetical protein